MEKTQYYLLCESFTNSAEKYFNDRLEIVKFYFSLLTKLVAKLGSLPNVISIYKYQDKIYEDFSDSIKYNEPRINNAMIPESRDSFNFDFKIKINKSFTKDIKHTIVFDDVIIKTKIIKISDVYNFYYSTLENAFIVSDYNDDSQMKPIVDDIIKKLFDLYAHPGISYLLGGMSLREL